MTRYSLTLHDTTTGEHGFADVATPAEARAWLERMLTGKAKPAPAPRPQPSKNPGELLAPLALQAQEPDPSTMAARVLRAVRRGPATLTQVKKRLPGVAASSVRGRLSELVALGLVTREGDTFAAAPTPPATVAKSRAVRAAPSPPPARKRTR